MRARKKKSDIWLLHSVLSLDYIVGFSILYDITCLLVVLSSMTLTAISISTIVEHAEKNFYFSISTMTEQHYMMVIFWALCFWFTDNYYFKLTCFWSVIRGILPIHPFLMDLLIPIISLFSVTINESPLFQSKAFRRGNAFASCIHFSRFLIIILSRIIEILFDWRYLTFTVFVIFSTILTLKSIATWYLYKSFNSLENNNETHEVQAGKSGTFEILWPKEVEYSSNTVKIDIISLKDQKSILKTDDTFLHPEFDKSKNILNIHYRLTKVGSFEILLFYQCFPIVCGELIIHVNADDFDPESSSLIVIGKPPTIGNNQVYKKDTKVHLGVLLRDQYKNHIRTDKNDISILKNISVNVSNISYNCISIITPTENTVYSNTTEGEINSNQLLCEIEFPLQKVGVHRVIVSMNHIPFHGGEFDIICITSKHIETIRKSLSVSKWCKLIPEKKSAAMFITPTQVYIKEYILGFIPISRRFTWPLNESLSASILKENEKNVLFNIEFEDEIVQIEMAKDDFALLYAAITIQLKKKYVSSSLATRVSLAKDTVRQAAGDKVINAVISRDNLLRDGCKLLLQLTNKHEGITVTFNVCKILYL